MDQVTVAIIGAGPMTSSAHAPSLAAMEDVRIAAICDLNADAAQQLAARFSIPQTFTDYREMIAQTNPDAVWVVIRPHHLVDVANAVLAMGKHLFTEKPPGITSDQTRQLAHAAARRGCLTCVGFQRRYTSITAACRERVLARGPMYQCISSFLKWYDAGPYYDGAIDILTSDVIHAVDTLRWMAGGNVQAVASDVRARGKEFATQFNAFVRFDSDVVGYLQSNWRVGGRQLRLEMHGDGISCLVTPEEGAIIYEAGKQPETLAAADLNGGSDMFRLGFFQEARHFIDCIKANRQPDTNLSDALKTMKLCDQIMRNAPPWTDQ